MSLSDGLIEPLRSSRSIAATAVATREVTALVMIVLLLMLGSVRAGLLVATVIPLSMLGAVLGMVSFDVPGGAMAEVLSGHGFTVVALDSAATTARSAPTDRGSVCTPAGA